MFRNHLFKNTNFIACACIGITEEGEVCNINADTIAAQLAIGLKANKLIYMSNVDGVTVEEAEHLRIGSLVAELGFAAVVVVGDDPGIARGAGRIVFG